MDTMTTQTIDRVLDGITIEEAKALVASRNGLDLEELTMFLANFSKMLNPGNRDLSLYYPLSGPDAFTPLLIANPTKLVLVERVPVEEDLDAYPSCISQKELSDRDSLFSDTPGFIKHYIRDFFSRGLTFAGELKGNMFPFIVADLFLAGVDPDSVEFYSEHPLKTFRFRWRHPYDKTPREHEIVVVNDMLNMATDYIRSNGISGEGFDIVLDKGSISTDPITLGVSEFLKDGGFFVMDRLMSSRFSIGNADYEEVPLPPGLQEAYQQLTEHRYQFGYHRHLFARVYVKNPMKT